MSEEEELLEIWSALDAEDRHEVLLYAMRLSNRLSLRGGPYDGLRLDPAGWNTWIYVKHSDDTVAVYVSDQNCNYSFARLQKMGEGCMPDVYPNRGGQ